MFESFTMNESNPDVLEINKTKLTRAFGVIFVISLMGMILLPAFTANLTWPQIKVLLHTQLEFAGLVLALFLILLWTIKNMLAEHKISFNSNKMDIEKNGRKIAKFNDIRHLQITEIYGQYGGFSKLHLVLKEDKEWQFFPQKISIGINVGLGGATEIGFKIAEIIGVEVVENRWFGDKVLKKK